MLRLFNQRISTPSMCRLYSKKKDAEKVIPKNILEDTETGHLQPTNGPIVDCRPFKITLKANKPYAWCLCGKSKGQPLCDSTHNYVHYKITLKPVRFAVEKDGEYWLCMCKQTKHRPFCDGTHKEQHIQDAIIKKPATPTTPTT